MPGIHNGERIVPSTNGEKWICLCKKVKLDPYLMPFTKLNSKWIKDLKIRPETLKLLDENTGEKPLDIGIGNLQNIGNESKNREVGLRQLKSFSIAKEKIKRVKRQLIEWEKIQLTL